MNLGLTPEQLAERHRYIGGTDAARIMKGEWRELWAEKTGRKEPQDLWDRLDPRRDFFLLRHFTKERMELARVMGHWTEPLNAAWFEKQTGREVEYLGPAASRALFAELVGRPASEKPTLAVHPTISYMACNRDALTTTIKGFPCLMELKHAGSAGDTTVIRHTAQATHNALVSGYGWWCISFFFGNSKWEMIEQEVDPFFASELIEREAEFWRYVETGEEPADRIEPVEAPKPIRYRTIDLADANKAKWPNFAGEMIDEMGVFTRTKEAADAHFIARERIKALLPEDVGLVTRGLVAVKRSRTGSVTISLAKKGKPDARPDAAE
jgi:hypothetical protein